MGTAVIGDMPVEALADSGAIANTHFLGGIDRGLQVLDAERQLFDVELHLARVRRDELLTIVQLYNALGGAGSITEHQQAQPLTRSLLR